MKFKFLTYPLVSIAILSASTLTLASALPPKPTACPTVAALHSVGVNRAHKDARFEWLAINQKDTFETKDEWSLVVMAGNEIKSEKEAIEKGNATIASLSLIDGPQIQKGAWWCLYSVGHEMHAWTITPAGNIL